MGAYEEKILHELIKWQQKMSRKPSITSQLTKGLQRKINNIIPEKVHHTITDVIKNMVKLVLIGSEFTTSQQIVNYPTLQKLENSVLAKINFYRKTAAVSGAGTGAGGLLVGLADLPILLGMKIKFLFDVATIYGFDVKDFRERLYILYVFELAFSSQEKRVEVYNQLLNWNRKTDELPTSIESFDWRSFQQEYRDYIDLAKLAQLIPGIGAVFGAYVNYQLMDKLGETAMNCYRLRLLNRGEL